MEKMLNQINPIGAVADKKQPNTQCFMKSYPQAGCFADK